jgi:menaquinone-dependent protoporphyrinogen oxidase
MIQTRILVAYASRHGSTREVADAVAATLRSRGLAVDVMPAGDVGHLRHYAGVVLGGALYTGRLHKDARRFLARHRDALAGRVLAVFALGPRTLAPDDVAASRAQVDRALARGPKPVSVTVFGGVVQPGRLRFPFNRMPASDARDWTAIAAWASALADRFSPRVRTSTDGALPPTVDHAAVSSGEHGS